MSVKNVVVSKRPNLISTTPSDNTYKNLSESQLLAKVKLLHEQILQTNKYLMDVHRIAIYNWDSTDTGNIIVELPESNRGFLLDSVVRLRGVWNPYLQEPRLTAVDTAKIGWVYKVSTPADITLFGALWKNGDYALYDESGTLHSVREDLFKTIFSSITTTVVSTEEPTDSRVQFWYRVVSSSTTPVEIITDVVDFGSFESPATVWSDYGYFINPEEIQIWLDYGVWGLSSPDDTSVDDTWSLIEPVVPEEPEEPVTPETPETKSDYGLFSEAVLTYDDFRMFTEAIQKMEEYGLFN